LEKKLHDQVYLFLSILIVLEYKLNIYRLNLLAYFDNFEKEHIITS